MRIEIHSFYSVVLKKRKPKDTSVRYIRHENPTSTLPDEDKSTAEITPVQADTQAIEMKGISEKP